MAEIKKYRPYLSVAELEHLVDLVNTYTPTHTAARCLRRCLEDVQLGLRSPGSTIVGKSMAEKLQLDFAADEAREGREEKKRQEEEKKQEDEYHKMMGEKMARNELTPEEVTEYMKKLGY